MWNQFLVAPIYNTLIVLTNTLWGQMFLSVIAVTIIVRLILAPLTLKALKAQLSQQKLKPKMDHIKREISDKTEQSKALMELYKESGVSPFAGCLPVIIQLPIILALYQAFLAFASSKTDLLYPGLELAQNFSSMFIGLNLFEKSIPIALLAGISQYLQLSLSPMSAQVSDPNDPQAGLQQGMKYAMPVMIVVFASAVPSAVALYWFTSNVVTILVEKFMYPKLHTQK